MNLLLARLAHLCDRVTVEEEITTDELERISPSERQTLLQDFAGVRKPCPKKTFPDLFFAQAVAAPEREALILEDRSLSYGALWEAASRLAARLGFGEERFIAIMADRSFELVISVIGILLAGAAYLPLDPDFPTERLEYILADSRPQAVLCCLKEKNEKAETLFEKLGIPVIHLSDDPDCGEVPRNSGETELLPPPATELLWERIAYMLYTSGSTGNPKGVEVEHKTLSGMISSHVDVYGSFRNDIVLLLTNYVFDMSIEQMLIPLAEGGRVCIMPK
jgi:non-ribosomal peptide synthetase component F